MRTPLGVPHGRNAGASHPTWIGKCHRLLVWSDRGMHRSTNWTWGAFWPRCVQPKLAWISATCCAGARRRDHHRRAPRQAGGGHSLRRGIRAAHGACTREGILAHVIHAITCPGLRGVGKQRDSTSTNSCTRCDRSERGASRRFALTHSALSGSVARQTCRGSSILGGRHARVDMGQPVLATPQTQRL